MAALLAAVSQGSPSPGHPHTSTALPSGTALPGSLHCGGSLEYRGGQSWLLQTAPLHIWWGLEKIHTVKERGNKAPRVHSRHCPLVLHILLSLHGLK